jgi:hypothetical protein
MSTHAGTRRGACRGRRSLRTAHCFGSARLQQGESPYFVPLFRNSYPYSEIRTLIPKLSLCLKLRTLRSDHRILVAIVVPLIPIVRTGFPIIPSFFRLSVTVLVIRIFRTVAVAPIIGTDIESQHRDSDLQYCVHIRLVSDALVPKHKT